MAAVTPTTVQAVDLGGLNMNYGSSIVPLKLVYIDVTSTAVDNTIALNSYVDGDITGILGVLVNAVDGATSTTSPTWSSDTVTLAQHAGSGGCKMLLLVY